MRHLAGDLWPGERRVDGHVHCLSQLNRQVCHDPLVTILGNLYHAVARLDTDVAQSNGPSPNVLKQAIPRDRLETPIAPDMQHGPAPGSAGLAAE